MKSPGTALLVCLVFAMSPVLQAGEIYGEPEAPLVAEVLGTDIHTVDPEEMKYVIDNSGASAVVGVFSR